MKKPTEKSLDENDIFDPRADINKAKYMEEDDYDQIPTPKELRFLQESHNNLLESPDLKRISKRKLPDLEQYVIALQRQNNQDMKEMKKLMKEALAGDNENKPKNLLIKQLANAISKHSTEINLLETRWKELTKEKSSPKKSIRKIRFASGTKKGENLESATKGEGEPWTSKAYWWNKPYETPPEDDTEDDTEDEE